MQEKKTRKSKAVKEVIVEPNEPSFDYVSPSEHTEQVLEMVEPKDEGANEGVSDGVSEIPSPKLPDMRMIDTIICHCDDSDVDGYDDIEEVRKDHMMPVSEGGRGFKDVAYHYYIKGDGTIQLGRPLSEIGSHAKGHNEHSIGICVHGRKLFTAASLQSLEYLIRKLLVEVPTIKKVIGHSDVASWKTCPNFGMKRFKMLVNEI
jgi:hypothetical protein